MELVLCDYGTYASPQNDMIGGIRGACNFFSYNFSSGTYFLTGEVDCGAWSFVYSLLDASNPSTQYKMINLDGKPVNLSEIEKLTFHVGQYEMYGNKPFSDILRQALRETKTKYTFDDICEIFGVDEARRDREFSALSSQKWRFTIALGLAMNKKIFVFPWLSKTWFRSTDFFSLLRILNKENVLSLVPCSEKIQIPQEEKFTVVRMNSLFEIDFDTLPDGE